eukprot:jgi/Bigna1/136842/aug1.36_g11550
MKITWIHEISEKRYDFSDRESHGSLARYEQADMSVKLRKVDEVGEKIQHSVRSTVGASSEEKKKQPVNALCESGKLPDLSLSQSPFLRGKKSHTRLERSRSDTLTESQYKILWTYDKNAPTRQAERRKARKRENESSALQCFHCEKRFGLQRARRLCKECDRHICFKCQAPKGSQVGFVANVLVPGNPNKMWAWVRYGKVFVVFLFITPGVMLSHEEKGLRRQDLYFARPIDCVASVQVGRVSATLVSEVKSAEDLEGKVGGGGGEKEAIDANSPISDSKTKLENKVSAAPKPSDTPPNTDHTNPHTAEAPSSNGKDNYNDETSSPSKDPPPPPPTSRASFISSSTPAIELVKERRDIPPSPTGIAPPPPPVSQNRASITVAGGTLDETQIAESKTGSRMKTVDGEEDNAPVSPAISPPPPPPPAEATERVKGQHRRKSIQDRISETGRRMTQTGAIIRAVSASRRHRRSTLRESWASSPRGSRKRRETKEGGVIASLKNQRLRALENLKAVWKMRERMKKAVKTAVTWEVQEHEAHLHILWHFAFRHHRLTARTGGKSIPRVHCWNCNISASFNFPGDPCYYAAKDWAGGIR